MSYKDAAGQYFSAGWLGVLPVPAGRKDPVPVGYTGYDGAYPSRADIQDWCDNGFTAKVEGQVQRYSADDANLALRLPNTVIGVDVDAYGDKTGRECLSHAEELWGELPPTVRSSSRIDGVSGIRLYRVPPGTRLKTVIAFPALGLAGIEIIQYFHRYCIAWPSVHPTTKRVYRWLTGDFQIETRLPQVGSIVDLPARWVEALSAGAEQEITVHADVSSVLSSLSSGMPSQRVQDCYIQAVREIENSTGGRHDEAMRAIGRLLRLHEQDEIGVGTALERLGRDFVYAITADGSRTQEQAQAEWDRMLTGHRIHDKIASTPSRNNALDTVMGSKAPSLEAVMQDYKGLEIANNSVPELRDSYRLPGGQNPKNPPNQNSDQDQLDDSLDLIMGSAFNRGEVPATDSEFRSIYEVESTSSDDGLDEWDRILLGEDGSNKHNARTGWGPRDLDDVLDSDDFAPEPATVGRRDDGACLFYPGKVNALIGPPESAKSWVAQHVASQELQAGNTVLYLDFEDSKRGVVGRMVFLGVEREVIRSSFLYADPPKALDQDSAAELFQTIDTYSPTLIVVDGLGAVMALHNHEMKDNTEYIKFNQLLLTPLSATGAAVVVIDHVAKANAEESNGYAIGAQAKKQMLTGAQIRVQAVKRFGRGREGKLNLWIDKDRHGGVREFAEPRGKFQQDYWATVFVDARESPAVGITMRFESKEDQDSPNNEGKLHMKMQEVSQFLEASDKARKGMSTNAVQTGMGGNKADVASALAELALRGNVSVSEGPRKAKVYVMERAYKGPEDDLPVIMGEVGK